MTHILSINKEAILIRCSKSFTDKVDEMVEYYGSISRANLIRRAVMDLFLGDYRKNKYGYSVGLETSRARKKEQGIPTNDQERIEQLANMDDYTLTQEMFKRGYFTEETLPNGDIKTFKILQDEVNNLVTWVRTYHAGEEEPFYKFILHSNFDELMNGLKKAKKLKIE